VVLPCLDEAETLARCITKAQDAMVRLGVAGEVVVADNGSADGSQEIAAAHGARVIRVPERGYGAALRDGFEAARGTYVIMADADDSYALDDLDPFVTGLREGADLVIGNRFAGGIAPDAMPRLHRYVGNPVLSFLGRRFFQVPIHDFHCGMRGFRREPILRLDLRTSGMEFASEMVVRAALAGLDVREVPTTLRPAGRSRAPHLRTWRDGWRHLRFLLAFCPRWLFLYPALLLVVGGTAAFVALWGGPVQVGDVAFDVQTMTLAATAIVVGLQAGGMALVSRAYGAELGLLPRSHQLERALNRVTLEWGLLVGLLMILGGGACYLAAVLHWSQRGFGELATDDMRLPLLGMLLVVAGAQMILVSFLLSLTRIGEERRRPSSAGPDEQDEEPNQPAERAGDDFPAPTPS
jgi:hypothetical protein